MKPPTSTLPVIPLEGLTGNPVPHLDAMQQFLAPYTSEIATFWWFVWFFTLLVIIRYTYVHGIRGGDPKDRELYSE